LMKLINDAHFYFNTIIFPLLIAKSLRGRLRLRFNTLILCGL
jgi:hypothetical protein